MMRCRNPAFVVPLLVLSVLHQSASAQIQSDYLKKAQGAFAKGRADEAIDYLNKAIALDPKNVQAYLLRGTMYEALRRHTEALADFDQTLKLDPKAAEAYNRRGSERLKIGQINDAILDFDRFLELKPTEEPGHWRRGIAYYYARRFEEGKKQFEGYQGVDNNDVENAVWRYLCMVPLVGIEKARTSLLRVGNDRRIPMMQVYALFQGKAKPADVLNAARSGKPSAVELNERLFYAHLYLSLYYEAEREREKSLEHIDKTVEQYKIGHYMWDIARLHRQLRLKQD